MKVFAVTHPGLQARGVTIIVAESRAEAEQQLHKALVKLIAAAGVTLLGGGEAIVWRELDVHNAGAFVVSNGDQGWR